LNSTTVILVDISCYIAADFGCLYFIWDAHNKYVSSDETISSSIRIWDNGMGTDPERSTKRCGVYPPFVDLETGSHTLEMVEVFILLFFSDFSSLWLTQTLLIVDHFLEKQWVSHS